MNIPEELRYTENHEWISVEGAVATVGITDYAQGELGDIVFVDIPTQGQTVNKDDVIGNIEAVKTVSDIFSPISGKVVKVNPALESSPEKINKSPYKGGWIVQLEVSDPAELKSLLTAADYQQQIGA